MAESILMSTVLQRLPMGWDSSSSDDFEGQQLQAGDHPKLHSPPSAPSVSGRFAARPAQSMTAIAISWRWVGCIPPE